MKANKFKIKESEAIRVASAALEKSIKPAAAFGGGKESMVLMHLLLSLKKGAPMPVLFIKPGREHSRLFYFIEKIRMLWSLDIITVDRTDLQGKRLQEDTLFGEEISALSSYAFQRYGFSHLFMGLRRSEDNSWKEIAPVHQTCSGAIVNPLVDFSREDIREYIKEYDLPECSLYYEQEKIGCLPPKLVYAQPLSAVHDIADEEAMVRERLKGLGYL